ncbi:cellulose binding domain-containing protein [Nonomuraea sp. NPDC050643]|uniref:GH12 family glycosyl hydrolase domain-containing protein n=1 Tax=Nonomuraea sp. NPDC050643 TaxID=3155660 RepID=UPI00340F459F
MRHAHIHLIIGALLATGLFAAPAQAAPVLCEKYGSAAIQSNRYIVQNNVWGASTAQCIDVNQSGGFTVTQAAHNNSTSGAPAGYPSIYAGCHYANCTTGSNLPMQASASGFAGLRSSVSMTYPGSGTYNASYDLWFDPTPRTDGQNTGAELMIWLNRAGSIQPIGSRVGTVSLAGASWEVWFGNTGWNVISYVRTSPATSLDFTINTFFSDVVSRGYGQRSWYLTSVQAGFEPWIGGTGLAVNSFSFGSGGTDTSPPTTPGNPAASGTTSTGTTLSWGASTDSGGSGLAGYDILRATGDTFTRVGGSTTTSYTDSGLSPATTYRYRIQARDGAGNLSPESGTVTVTTQPGGGGGGGCAVTATTQNAWNNGYVIQPVTVTNRGTSALSGWTVTFPLPSGHTITGIWNASYTVSGGTVTVRNLGHNGGLAPNAGTSFGFQATRPTGNTQVPSGYTCT